MEFAIEELISWIYTLSPKSVYLIFILIAYLENVMPPIPGDILVVFGGYLAAEQVVGFGALLALTTLASVAGFMSMYGIGSYWGYWVDKRRERYWLSRWIDMAYFDKGKRWVRRYGQWIILANRFLAGTRSVIAITAGIYRTRIKTTILSSFVSSLLWNSILLGLGWFVHENWQLIGSWLNVYGWAVGGLLLLLFSFWFFRKRLSRRKSELVGKKDS